MTHTSVFLGEAGKKIYFCVDTINVTVKKVFSFAIDPSTVTNSKMRQIFEHTTTQKLLVTVTLMLVSCSC